MVYCFSPPPPITSPPHPPLHPLWFFLSLTVSLSLAPWRHVKCAQISVMGWEFITFTLRPFMRSHPGALCRTVNQAWQRWGGGWGGWRGLEVSSSSTLCLVSQEEKHCGGEKTHLRIDTRRTRWQNTHTHTHYRDAERKRERRGGGVPSGVPLLFTACTIKMRIYCIL